MLPVKRKMIHLGVLALLIIIATVCFLNAMDNISENYLWFIGFGLSIVFMGLNEYVKYRINKSEGRILPGLPEPKPQLGPLPPTAPIDIDDIGVGLVQRR